MAAGAAGGLSPDEAPEEAFPVLELLQVHLFELPGVEEQAFAERALVRLDAVQVFFLHVVPAFRALHVVERLEPLALGGRLLLLALLLALLAGGARLLDQFLLVGPEPVVLAAALRIVQAGLLSRV